MDCSSDDHDGQAQELQDIDPEVFMLREQIRVLTKQFYTERQQWLAEKRRLRDEAKQLQAVSSSPTEDGQGEHCSRRARQGFNSGVSQRSEAGSETVCDVASQGSLSAREPCSSSSCSSPQSTTSASLNQTGSVAPSSSSAGGNVSSPNSELLHTLADIQRQLEESRRQQESAAIRWALEREALQRQIHALISMSGGGFSLSNMEVQDGPKCRDGDAGSGALMTHGSLSHAAQEDEEERQQLLERVSELEVIVEELQAERDNLEGQLQVLAAEATRARRATRWAVDSLLPSPSPSSRTSLAEAPSPPPPAAAATGSIAAVLGSSSSKSRSPTLRDNISVDELLSEKAELERELQRYRSEYVPVPRPEYAELSSLRSQVAFLQSEVSQLQEEVEVANQMKAAAEGELLMALQTCTAVPHEEYQRLLRVEAESRALCAVEAAASLAALKSGARSVPVEEHLQLLVAVQERDELAEQVTALQQRLMAAEVKAEETTVVCTAEAAVGDGDVGASADAEAAAAAEVATMQFEVTALREQLEASVRASWIESGRLVAQVSELQEEVEMLRSQNAELKAESDIVRHALAAGQVQANEEAWAAAMTAEKARIALESELQEAQQRISALEEELSMAKREVVAALIGRRQLSLELAAVRDAALRTSQALSDCLYERYDEAGAAAAAAAAATLGEACKISVSGVAASTDLYGDDQSMLQALQAQLAAAQSAAEAAQAQRHKALLEAVAAQKALESSEAAREAAEAASEAMLQELDATKRELAGVQGHLEQLFKREVLQPSRRIIRGIPQEWMYAGMMSQCSTIALAARPIDGSGGGGAASEHPQAEVRREVVSVPLSESDIDEEGTSGDAGSQLGSAVVPTDL